MYTGRPGRLGARPFFSPKAQMKLKEPLELSEFYDTRQNHGLK